jgi:hypothetical protein
MTAAILAAVILIGIALAFAIRADLHRYAIARVMELRPTVSAGAGSRTQRRCTVARCTRRS